MPGLENLLADAQRQVTICNACRYCEGYCPAFPAMELRDEITTSDLSYIANLCHDCRACYQACPFTEPHEFAINIPALLSEARVATYAEYAAPHFAGDSFRSSRFTYVVAGTLAMLAAIAIAALALSHQLTPPVGRQGDFYAVISYGAILGPALLLSAYAATTVVIGAWRFFRAAGDRRRPVTAREWPAVVGDILLLRWMRGGGDGCHYPDPEQPSTWRRWFHQAMAGGFLSAFLATIAAGVEQDLLGVQPPYPFVSAPVVLGAVGGALLLVGTVGLLALKGRDPDGLGSDVARSLDYSLLWSLTAIAVTGIALLLLRRTAAMGPVLIVHLACVAFFLVMLPYGKFVHVSYRAAALVIWQGERTKVDA